MNFLYQISANTNTSLSLTFKFSHSHAHAIILAFIFSPLLSKAFVPGIIWVSALKERISWLHSYLKTRLCMSFFIRKSQLSLKGLLSKMRWNNNLLSDSFQILRSLYISTLWEKKSLWLWIQDSIWGVVIKIHSLYEIPTILEIYWQGKH